MKVTELEQAAVINQNNIFFWKRITENYFSGKILHPIFFWMKGLWKKTSSYLFLVESILGQKNPFLVESLWTKKLNQGTNQDIEYISQFKKITTAHPTYQEIYL